MAALALMVCLAVAVFHWAMEPILNWLPSLMEVTALPWVLLALGLWLLAGRPEAR